MADIVITEFLDNNSLSDLKKTHDVHYGPDLVDRREELLAALGQTRAIIVRNRTWVLGSERKSHQMRLMPASAVPSSVRMVAPAPSSMRTVTSPAGADPNQ